MPVYSHSRLSSFEQCPLKYKYAYIDKLPRDRRPTIEAFMGNRVHEAMEKLYQDVSRARPPAIEELADFFQRRWDDAWTPEIIIVKQDYDAGHYRRVGERCLRDYYRRYHPFDQARTVGLERRVALQVAGRYRLSGVIDRLARQPDGGYEIHDYKTSTTLPNQAKLDEDRQLALYQLGVQQEFHDAQDVRLIWHYLAFDTSFMSTRSAPQLIDVQERVAELIGRIETTTQFPPRESALCRWCEFQDICPVWSKAPTTETPAAETTDAAGSPGAALVDRLVELRQRRQSFIESAKRQLQQIDAQIEETERRMVTLSQAEGDSRVSGSRHDAEVTTDWRWKLPATTDPKRQALEQLLRSAGVWEQVSALDGVALNRTLKAGAVGDDVIALAETLLVKEPVRRIDISLRVPEAEEPIAIRPTRPVVPAGSEGAR